jgi:hypothetical protein
MKFTVEKDIKTEETIKHNNPDRNMAPAKFGNSAEYSL